MAEKGSPRKKRTLDEWRTLVEKALKKGGKSNGTRLAGSKLLIEGNPEQHLRKYGIESIEDLMKDPPDPKDKPS